MAAALESVLTEIGFKPKETAVYLALLRHGTRPTSFLAAKSGLNRGTAYVVLHTLLSKGLVIKSTKRNVQQFTAREPQALMEYAERRTHSLAHAKSELSGMMSELMQMVNPLTTRPKVEFFDGKEGVQSVLLETLKNKKRELRAFLSIADLSELVGAEFFAEYTRRRIESSIPLMTLRAREKDRQALARDIHAHTYMSNKRELREVRYIGGDLIFPVSMYIFDDKLAILSSPEENFGLIIESRELTAMQGKLFELLWATASKEKPAKTPRKRN